MVAAASRKALVRPEQGRVRRAPSIEVLRGTAGETRKCWPSCVLAVGRCRPTPSLLIVERCRPGQTNTRRPPSPTSTCWFVLRPGPTDEQYRDLLTQVRLRPTTTVPAAGDIGIVEAAAARTVLSTRAATPERYHQAGREVALLANQADKFVSRTPGVDGRLRSAGPGVSSRPPTFQHCHCAALPPWGGATAPA